MQIDGVDSIERKYIVILKMQYVDSAHLARKQASAISQKQAFG